MSNNISLKFPREISIASVKFIVKKDPTHNGGSFSFKDGTLIIGTECINEDPGYTFMVICHEISEIIHVAISTRYSDLSVESNFKFFMDHKEFENHNRLFAEAIRNFIK